MQHKHTIKILILAFVLGCLNAKSQMPTSMYFLETIPQSNFMNAAMAPRCNTFIGLPSVYFNLQHNMPINTLLQKTDSGTVSFLSPYYDLGKLESKLGAGFNIRNNIVVTPISFGVRLNKGYFTFAFSNKTEVNGTIPTDFFTIPNKHFFPTNTTYDFAGIGLDAQIYNEYAFGYSRNITRKLRVGGRFKILQGLASVVSDVSKMQITTSENLITNNEWNLNVNGDIYTSGPLTVIPKEDGTIDTLKIDEKLEGSDAMQLATDYATNFSNLGFAFDMGATYTLNYSWSFSAAINNLGLIRWNNSLNSIHFNGDYEFGGLDLTGETIDSTEQATDELMDSIQTVVNYHAENKAFITRPTTMLHIGSQYNVSHYFSAGILSSTSFNRNYFHQEFTLSANLNTFKGGLTTNLNYNIALNGEQYAGFGLAFKLLPIQFYLMLDHIPIVYANYNIYEDSEDIDPEKIPLPYDLRSFNVMVGLNLIFGAHGYKDSPKIDAYSEF